MKACLLVGGLGTRLQPITFSLPKCLVEINGKPLINYWMEALEKAGISEVLVNLHHFPEMVQKHLTLGFPKMAFTFYYEETLLGSAGTIRENMAFFRDDPSMLVIYGDNFTDMPLQDFLLFDQRNTHDSSIALFRSENPSACGIVTLDDENKVVAFEEKPVNPVSNLANAGLYVFKKAAYPIFLSQNQKNQSFDIGFHVLPQLIGKMKGFTINHFYLDIGTLKNLDRAKAFAANNLSK